MRNGRLILLSTLGLLACAGKRLHVGDDGAGGGPAGSGGGQAGAAAGAAGSIAPSGKGGTTGAGGMGGSTAAAGTGGAAGQVGGGGAAGGSGLSVNPNSATFAGTLVEAVSTPQTFTVRNDGSATLATTTTLAALAGTNAADFLISSNGCGTALQPGTSCEIGVAFAPKTRSGPRTASLAVGDPSGLAANVSLSGTALPSLGLLAGALGGPGSLDGTGADARFAGPSGIASDGAGNFYVTDGNAIRKVAGATGAVTTVVGADAGLYQPFGIATDGAGYLYVIDGSMDAGLRLQQIAIATGTVTAFAAAAGTGGRSGGTATPPFNHPYGIATDGAGNLYVADINVIRKVVFATGAVTTFVGADAGFDQLYGIASDGAGNLFLSDVDTIRRVVIATGAVTTLAGTAGQPGTIDGTGAAARFDAPAGLTSDGAGNLYVVEMGNYTVRKIVIATGAVTTLLGTANQFGAGDGMGGLVRSAHPYGIASDGAGNLYLPDWYHYTLLRVVNATGAVTTLAGTGNHFGAADGTGAAARFLWPSAIAGDGAGNLYVVDNNTIRKVVIATGAVTMLAGAADHYPGSADGTGAAASFDQPCGIACDGAGNLYVTDYNNQTIRKVVITTGAVTTLAGTKGPSGTADGTGAAARFTAPYGIASDGAGNLFVTDVDTSSIRKIVIATRAVTTFSGWGAVGSADETGAPASFNGPAGIASDGVGNLYVADYGSGTIRKIVIATRSVTTFAGAAGQLASADGTGAAARFVGPAGIASDGAGNLFVIDGGFYGGNTVRKVAIATATVSTIIGSPGRVGVSLGALPASLNSSRGMVVLPTGELAILEYIENAVLIGHL